MRFTRKNIKRMANCTPQEYEPWLESLNANQVTRVLAVCEELLKQDERYIFFAASAIRAGVYWQFASPIDPFDPEVETGVSPEVVGEVRQEEW